jgi:hypothetical protein
MVEDLVLGFILSKLFAPKAAQSPAVVFPPSSAPSSPAAPVPQPPTPAQAQLPAPPPATQQPAQQPAAQQPAQPQFPAQVAPPAAPQTQAPAGFKRAIEVWQVNPSIVAQAKPVLSGLGVGAEAITIQLMETEFPKGWVGKKSATAEEAANAKRLLSQWKDGGTLFLGPATLADRRAYRMTKHPIAAAPGQPAAPAPFQPPQVTNPQPAPPAAQQHPAPGSVVTIPEVTITPGPPGTATPAGLVTTVRKGEGLANIAKRLGFPANAASATAIQKANVPQGPDAQWTATALTKGGLAKKGRAGGLQPGDRLFVPTAWAVDPGAL